MSRDQHTEQSSGGPAAMSAWGHKPTEHSDSPECRLLDEDKRPIKRVSEAVRKAWERRKLDYSREQYEADRRARERRS